MIFRFSLLFLAWMWIGILFPCLPGIAAAQGGTAGKKMQTGEDAREVNIPTYIQKQLSKKVWKECEVDFLIRSAAICDIDGDGKNELISTDGKSLRIDQWCHGKIDSFPKSTLSAKKRFFFFRARKKGSGSAALDRINRAKRGIRYILLTGEDLDLDGRDELLFNAVQNHQVISGILRYQNHNFSLSVTEEGLYLKIFYDAVGNPVLVGQKLGVEGSIIHQYLWDGTHFTKGKAWELPGGGNLLTTQSFHSYRMGDPDFIVLNRSGGLDFFSRSQKIITDSDVPGLLPLCTLRVRVGQNGSSRKERFYVPRRILTGDFERDGQKEVLLITKRPVLNIRGMRGLLTRHAVMDLTLSRGQVQEYWKTSPIFGEILDQAVGDIDNNGKRELVLFTRRGTLPFRKKTYVLIYGLE